MSIHPNKARDPADALQWITRRNWGALVFTPFWLLRNGFLLSLIVFCLLGWWHPWATVPVSALFMLAGNRWSWGDGTRWSDIESFAESQHLWDFLGRSFGLFWLFGLLLSYRPFYDLVRGWVF